MADNNSNIIERLYSLAFDVREVKGALCGKTVPAHLGRRLTRLCVIRGIRYHEQFTTHPDLKLLRQFVPEISRALNARAIMSNNIPFMPEARDRPYCIWHPEVASQDTYRKLWQQYPDMSYQIARACAVANYVELYLEMDLLPDVSVAEEARASGSMEIYEAIMRNPIRYAIMNDYTRDITLQNPKPACLNDDTAIVSSLDIKHGIGIPSGEEIEPIVQGPITKEEDDKFLFDTFDTGHSPGFEVNMFNITEDMSVGVKPVNPFNPVEPEELQLNYLPELLSQPLPVDLPQGNKNVLILMAAYYGNIERYARLRRPRMIKQEAGCVVRGIYHNSMFALWCATQNIPHVSVRPAIHARMIMNNDLSRIINLDTMQPFEQFLSNMPYLIWFPNPAYTKTYKTLASAVVSMRPSVLHAAVYTEDKALFDWMLDDLGVAPTQPASQEAHNRDRGRGGDTPSYFVCRLEARAQELGINLRAPRADFEMYPAKPQRSSILLGKELTLESVHSAIEDWGIYDGWTVDASEAELFASAPESWRPDSWVAELDYENWPRKEKN